ncbi:F-box only protein 41 [Nannospalax galili]|uniref:F-box only protein 41 n=1 Tax=Nannospalax galili TaxID=1026970 RepID=A0A8C6RI82_NANGA|nr:F-box only protein 41 [Nannospalax galili]XP_008822949.1 F-box only protein 41 [Nannospalax galili]XP_017651501.2 F-box only protein 41 [Nannospalax galili]XP_029415275.1 F-box only protein 41 [Nannospalax galili]
MASLDLPYRCPRCGEHKRFRSLSSLRAHLEYSHTYETLYILSKTNSICDGAAAAAAAAAAASGFPLAPEPAALLAVPGARREVFESTSFQGKEQTAGPAPTGPHLLHHHHHHAPLAHFPGDLVPASLPCEELAEPGLVPTAAARYALREIEIPLGELFARKSVASSACSTPPPGPGPGPCSGPASASPASPSPADVAYEEGLARLKIRALEKLEVDRRLERLSEEVEQKIAGQVGRLQAELERKAAELETARQESARLGREKEELEERASELSRQVDVSVELLASLKQDLVHKEQELSRKQQEVVQIDQFLKETAAREASAKLRLQQFIEELLERADRAERQLQVISSSCGSTPSASLGRGGGGSGPGLGARGPGRMREHHAGPAVPSTYAVSRHGSSPSTGASSRVPAASQSSGCYDSDSLELPRPEEGPSEDSGPGGLGSRAQATNGSSERSQAPRSSGLRRQAIQNWQRRPRRHSTEGEEGDVSDVGSRTTESEAEGPSDAPRPGPALAGPLNSCRLSARPEGGSGRGRRVERSSPSRSNEVISPEILKMRAALFCIFTYLDTRTLLHAAEVCRDWRFVARHPAVWTRVLLENARVCSKFLAMLAQWCTQAHSLTLQNLKPRQRGKKESKEEYARSTRGCLEAGLESLLKAAGGNLLILRISHCPNILTDRSLWLASCYCRALQAVTYRSATDPVGHEVIWALGAGCREIVSLQVAPLHPCQQPTRFSNRCLQMIGRCWPHLRALGVGGAGCGVQGLASLARNCMRLQVLELDHVSEITQEVAAEVCREGLKGLEMLVLTATPVTPKALLHFNSICRNLKSIVVQIGIADYFKEPSSPEAQKLFEDMVTKLQALRRRPGFSKILHVKVEGGC